MAEIVDAYGRPLQKAEVEYAAKRGLTMPASWLFGQLGGGFKDESIVDPFAVVGGSSGKLDPEDDELASNWNPGAQPSSPYGNLNPRFAHKNPIASLNIPRDTVGMMTQSLTYSQENYLVNRAIKVKRNFALRDLEFICSPSSREFYKTQFTRLRVRKILSHAFRYYWACGRCVIYWGEERPIQRLAILDPRSIIVRRILGKDVVYLLPDPRWKTILQQEKGHSSAANLSPEAKFLKANIPKYWIKYILDNKPIPLKDETYALVENDLELFSLRGIDAPSNLPLQPIFMNLATMDMLTSGDFSVAWMIKHMIALVSIGDPRAEGTNYVPPDENELKKLEATFQRPDWSLWAFVDPTVDIRWIYPDPKLFASDKYQHHIEAIEYCLGVPGVFTSADGDFSSSSLSIKPFREEIEYARVDMQEQFLAKFLPQLREGFTAKKTGGNKDPEISWDIDSLRDDKVIIDTLTALYDRGALSVHSLLEMKAQDFDTEVQRKISELAMMKKDDGLFEPAYDPAHGIMDEGGRPQTTGKPTAESTNGSPQPRPSAPTS
jgi:hypothetical protein